MGIPLSSCFPIAPMARREFLRAGSLSLFGMGMPQLLAARDTVAANLADASPRPRARACILLFMWGGPAICGRQRVRSRYKDCLMQAEKSCALSSRPGDVGGKRSAREACWGSWNGKAVAGETR